MSPRRTNGISATTSSSAPLDAASKRIAIDAHDGIWAQTADTFAHSGRPGAPAGAVVRVLDGGEITHRVETPLPCFTCTVGARHLFLLGNEWEGIEKAAEVAARRSARIVVADLAAIPRL